MTARVPPAAPGRNAGELQDALDGFGEPPRFGLNRGAVFLDAAGFVDDAVGEIARSGANRPTPACAVRATRPRRTRAAGGPADRHAAPRPRSGRWRPRAARECRSSAAKLRVRAAATAASSDPARCFATRRQCPSPPAERPRLHLHGLAVVSASGLNRHPRTRASRLSPATATSGAAVVAACRRARDFSCDVERAAAATVARHEEERTQPGAEQRRADSGVSLRDRCCARFGFEDHVCAVPRVRRRPRRNSVAAIVAVQVPPHQNRQEVCAIARQVKANDREAKQLHVGRGRHPRPPPRLPRRASPARRRSARRRSAWAERADAGRVTPAVAAAEA